MQPDILAASVNINELNNIPQGDVPGERVEIKEKQVMKTGLLFQETAKALIPLLSKNTYKRAVITICGGSGVGKTGIASIFAHYFKCAGVGCYILSGDNYPHRIPKYNDAERLWVFREGGIQGMVEDGVYTEENFDIINKWQKEDEDANPAHLNDAVWFASYLNGGRKALEAYLGTEKEIAFNEVGSIVSAFKDGAKDIWLRRMGREETELWYEKVDFRDTNILLIEWTHGNSDYYKGVDFPILLNSTPRETLAYRKSRNRDGQTDSAFTTLVLEIEQEMLHRQAKKAKLILSKSGQLLSYDEYCKIMEEGGM
ncbi:MAG: ATP-binding protein [Lachnospiraceae bacterium]|nr:ATP-binding protein [Lachnospiraceae bacterium]